MLRNQRALTRTSRLGVLAGVLLGASVANAADPPISEEARGHFKAGVALLQDPDGERVEEAYREFRAAYERSHSPKILGNMGLCAMKLERDGEAIEAYTQYLREVTDLDPADRAQITRDLQTLTTGVVELRLQVTAPPGTKVIVTDVRTPVKGERVTNTYPLPADATKLMIGARSGHHVLTARAAGFQDEPWEHDALAGSKETHEFRMRPLAGPSPSPSAPAPARVALEPEPAPNRVPWVVVGAGAAMVAAGAITGVVALGKQQTLADACPSDRCPATFDLAGARASAKTMIGVTDVLLIGGGVLVAGGVTWALVSSPKPRQPGTASLSGLSAACGPGGCSANAKVSF